MPLPIVLENDWIKAKDKVKKTELQDILDIIIRQNPLVIEFMYTYTKTHNQEFPNCKMGINRKSFSLICILYLSLFYAGQRSKKNLPRLEKETIDNVVCGSRFLQSSQGFDREIKLRTEFFFTNNECMTGFFLWELYKLVKLNREYAEIKAGYIANLSTFIYRFLEAQSDVDSFY